MSKVHFWDGVKRDSFNPKYRKSACGGYYEDDRGKEGRMTQDINKVDCGKCCSIAGVAKPHDLHARLSTARAALRVMGEALEPMSRDSEAVLLGCSCPYAAAEALSHPSVVKAMKEVEG